MDDTAGQLLRLLDEHGTRLHSLLMKLTLREDVAQELLQDLFLRLNGSSGLTRSTSPERYMYRAAINLAFDWRRRNRRLAANGELTGQEASCGELPVDEAIRREELERVLLVMKSLSDADRELVTLRFIQAESYEEIAQCLDSTPHRVRARCSKAVARLRKLVGRNRVEGRSKETKNVRRS